MLFFLYFFNLVFTSMSPLTTTYPRTLTIYPATLILSSIITYFIFFLYFQNTLSFDVTSLSSSFLFVIFLLLYNFWTFPFTISAYCFLLLFSSYFSGTIPYFSTNDWRGGFLPVDTTCPGTVHVVRGGDYARVSDSPYIDASWEGKRRDTALGDHGPQRRAMQL